MKHSMHSFRTDVFVLEGKTFTVRTPDDATFNHLWLEPREQHVQLQLQACKSAHVLLSAAKDDTSASRVEVVFGAQDNSKYD